jgi:hypothetical protein
MNRLGSLTLRNFTILNGRGAGSISSFHSNCELYNDTFVNNSHASAMVSNEQNLVIIDHCHFTGNCNFSSSFPVDVSLLAISNSVI